MIIIKIYKKVNQNVINNNNNLLMKIVNLKEEIGPESPPKDKNQENKEVLDSPERADEIKLGNEIPMNEQIKNLTTYSKSQDINSFASHSNEIKVINHTHTYTRIEMGNFESQREYNEVGNHSNIEIPENKEVKNEIMSHEGEKLEIEKNENLPEENFAEIKI